MLELQDVFRVMMLELQVVFGVAVLRVVFGVAVLRVKFGVMVLFNVLSCVLIKRRMTSK